MRIENKKSFRGSGKYIGRPSLLGNPFVIGKDGNRSEVCDKFEAYARGNARVMQEIASLKADDVLICWCAPMQCHGHRIEKLWKELQR